MASFLEYMKGLVFDDRGFEDFRKRAGELYKAAKPILYSLEELTVENLDAQLRIFADSYNLICPEYERLLFEFVMKKPDVVGPFPCDDDMHYWIPENYKRARDELDESTQRWIKHTFNDMRIHHCQTVASMEIVTLLINEKSGGFSDAIIDALVRLHVRLEYQMADLHNIAKLWPRKKKND